MYSAVLIRKSSASFGRSGCSVPQSLTSIRCPASARGMVQIASCADRFAYFVPVSMIAASDGPQNRNSSCARCLLLLRSISYPYQGMESSHSTTSP